MSSRLTNGNDFEQGSNISISEGRVISKEDKNTLYSSGIGCSLENNTFSCPGFNFSTTETVVGEWVNGATLYQKTLNFGALPKTTYKDVDTGLTGTAVRIVYFFCYAYRPSDSATFFIPNVAPSTVTSNITSAINIQFPCVSNKWYVRISTGSDRTTFTECYVTIVYTK